MGARWFGQNNYAGFFPARAALSRATYAGETLVGKRTMVRRVLGVVFGSCLYRFIVAVALRFNVPAAAMKLVSAIIVAVAISMPAIRAKFAFEQRKHNARKEVH